MIIGFLTVMATDVQESLGVLCIYISVPRTCGWTTVTDSLLLLCDIPTHVYVHACVCVCQISNFGF